MDFVSVRNFIELFKSTVNFIYSNASLPFSDAYWLTLSGFIIFLALIWVLQEMTTVRILRYVILFIGTFLSYYFCGKTPLLVFILIITSFWMEIYSCKCLIWLIAGVMNSLFSVYGMCHHSSLASNLLITNSTLVFDIQIHMTDIYDDLISRRVNSSDAEKFAEICPCCNGVGWGVIW